MCDLFAVSTGADRDKRLAVALTVLEVMKKPLFIPSLALLGIGSSVAQDIPYGVEAVTGVRSGYVFRGFKLADFSLDFQLESEIALGKDVFLNVGGSHLAESDGDFSETAAFFDLRRSFEDFSVGGSLSYRHFDHFVFESGVDFGFFADYLFNDEWDARVSLFYDTGAEGFYASGDFNWSKPLNEDSFVAVNGGISFVSDYYGRDGLNDVFGKLSYAYNINESVAVTPFMGFSIPIEESDFADDSEVYGGFSFQVIF